MWTHWVDMYGNAENLTNFDSFGLEHIPNGIRKFIGNKNIKANNTSIWFSNVPIFLYLIYWFYVKS